MRYSTSLSMKCFEAVVLWTIVNSTSEEVYPLSSFISPVKNNNDLKFHVCMFACTCVDTATAQLQYNFFCNILPMLRKLGMFIFEKININLKIERVNSKHKILMICYFISKNLFFLFFHNNISNFSRNIHKQHVTLVRHTLFLFLSCNCLYVVPPYQLLWKQ